MKQKRIFKWLTLDMIIFLVANIFLISYFGDRLSILGDIGYFKLLVLGLAAYRAANILSNESVTKPLRAPFVDEAQKDGKIIEEPKKSGFLGAIGNLIYCSSSNASIYGEEAVVVPTTSDGNVEQNTSRMAPKLP